MQTKRYRMGLKALVSMVALASMNGLGSEARADIISYTYEVSVRFSTIAGIKEGSKITGEFDIDTSIADSNANSSKGSYIGAVVRHEIVVKGNSISAEVGDLNIEDGSPDVFNIQSLVNPLNKFSIRNLGFNLADSTGNALNGDAIPNPIPPLDQWTLDKTMFIAGAEPNFALADISNLEIKVIPAPAAVLCGLIGLIGLVVWRRLAA